MSLRNFTYRTLPMANGKTAELSYHASLDKLILTVKDRSNNVLLTLVTTPPTFSVKAHTEPFGNRRIRKQSTGGQSK
jgi:hypothetical protein